ncbi:MAG: hypothetical protein RR551_07390 [Mucinivorans sp.]
MAQLSKILGSILRDMVAAQHEANMYALKLSSAYRDQNQATTMGPPAVCLGEIELMLHCGFTGNSLTGENYEIDQTAALRTIQELSAQASEVVISCILTTITQHSDGGNDNQGPIAKLNREKTLRRNFIAFLSRKLYDYLKGHRAEFIALDGGVDFEKLQENIIFIANDKFLSHSDLDDVFVEDVGGELRRTIRENLQANLQIMLPRILKDVPFGRSVKYSSMDVTVSSEELSKLPDECIQTLRLKILPRDIPTQTDTE